MNTGSVRLVLSTLPGPEEAEVWVRELVAHRHIACGTILPGGRSIYRWEGAVQTESECVVLLKTTDAALGGFLEKARELHPYDVPELLVLPVLGGNLDYLRWVVDETSGETGG